MFINLTKGMFMDEFRRFEGRYNQLGGYKGLSALYDYLTDLEESTGEPMELDVIALCCDFTHYENLEDITAEYDKIDTREELENHTTVIDVEGDGLIIQNF